MDTVAFIVRIVLAAVLVAVYPASTTAQDTENTVQATPIPDRPSYWAQPLDLPGAPNFFKVTDDLYRGAQPAAEGFGNLKAMGIKTIVTLRSFHGDSEKIEGTGLRYIHIYAKAWHAEDEDVLAFLKVATDKEMLPVFVHCQHGADRTGTMIAAYRIVVQGWPKTEAIREMREGGFGYHSIWKGLIEYLEKLDVDKTRAELGITAPSAPLALESTSPALPEIESTSSAK